MPTTSRQTSTTVKTGTRFRYTHADGNPLWEVTRSRGRGVWEAVIVNEPFEYNGRKIDSDFAGTVRVFRSQEILGSLAMASFFDKNASEHEKFYSGLKLGQVVHYHNGFGQFVRCEAVMGTTTLSKGKQIKCLKPVALVGNWQKYDLPRRGEDGTVHLGYHAERIVKGEVFEPNASNLYEFSKSLGAREADPRSLPALDLSVPPMTPEQEATAKLWKAVQAAQEALNDSNDRDPMSRLQKAQAAIQGAMPS